jgi:hypothetical protein
LDNLVNGAIVDLLTNDSAAIATDDSSTIATDLLTNDSAAIASTIATDLLTNDSAAIATDDSTTIATNYWSTITDCACAKHLETEDWDDR